MLVAVGERLGKRTICGSGLSHFGIGVDFLEVGLVALGGGFDGLLAGVPVRGADLDHVC